MLSGVLTRSTRVGPISENATGRGGNTREPARNWRASNLRIKRWIYQRPGHAVAFSLARQRPVRASLSGRSGWSPAGTRASRKRSRGGVAVVVAGNGRWGPQSGLQRRAVRSRSGIRSPLRSEDAWAATDRPRSSCAGVPCTRGRNGHLPCVPVPTRFAAVADA